MGAAETVIASAVEKQRNQNLTPERLIQKAKAAQSTQLAADPKGFHSV